MRPKKTNPPLIGCEWGDAHGDATRVISVPGDLATFHKPDPVITYGLLLQEDDAGVTIAMEDVDDSDYRGPTFIPRPLIRRIWRVSKNPKKGSGPVHGAAAQHLQEMAQSAESVEGSTAMIEGVGG